MCGGPPAAGGGAIPIARRRPSGGLRRRRPPRSRCRPGRAPGVGSGGRRRCRAGCDPRGAPRRQAGGMWRDPSATASADAPSGLSAARGSGAFVTGAPGHVDDRAFLVARGVLVGGRRSIRLLITRPGPTASSPRRRSHSPEPAVAVSMAGLLCRSVSKMISRLARRAASSARRLATSSDAWARSSEASSRRRCASMDNSYSRCRKSPDRVAGRTPT